MKKTPIIKSAAKIYGQLEKVQWLFLDMNSYFASVEQQLNPDFRGRPLIVVPADTDATCAIAASYEAKAFGIKTGTPVYEAKRRCRDLQVIVARHDHYVTYHHRILEEIDRHIPVDTVASIDEMACRLGPDEQSIDAAIALALRIKEGMRRNVGEYIRCSVGLSTNRFLAKVATDLQKPDGLVVLESSAIPRELNHLPLKALPGIGPGNYLRLIQANVTTLEDLWKVPPKHLRQIWGSVAGERFWYALHGQELEDAPTQRSTVGHSHVLSPEWRPPRMAGYVARRLLLKAASRLRRMNLFATHVHVSLRSENGRRLHLDRTFPPASDNTALLREMLALWEQLVAENGYHFIKKISITLHGLTNNQHYQYDMFSAPPDVGKANEKHGKASRVMDALNAKFGRDTVVMGGLPKRNLLFSGTKVAFSRIPDKAEFHE